MRFKILIAALIISIIPQLITGLYISYKVLPSYEKNVELYHTYEQNKIVEKIVNKLFDQILIQTKDYAIWNEIYNAVIKQDKTVIKFNWSQWLSHAPYNYSLIVGLNKKGEVIDQFIDDLNIDDIVTNRKFKTLFNTVISLNEKTEINAIDDVVTKKGFIKIKNNVYSYCISPVMDDKNLKKPIVGALFLAKKIDVLIKDIQPFLAVPIFFKSSKMLDNNINCKYGETQLLDMYGDYLGSLYIKYDISKLNKIKNEVHLIYILVLCFTFGVTFVLSLLIGYYYTRRLRDLEKYAFDLFSDLNGNISKHFVINNTNKNFDLFERIKFVINYLSEDIKRKIFILTQNESEIKALYEKEKENFNNLIKLFISLIELRDPYTKGHAERVRDLSKKIGKVMIDDMHFNNINLENLEIAAYLHDIGKVTIDERVLNKPDKLTKEEFEIVKKHSINGYIILSKTEYFNNISDIVLYHHENVDGSGYPYGKKGEGIPIESKIIAVADVFDALTTDRPYRTAYSKDKAIGLMSKDVGKKFDKVVFEAFLILLEKENIINRADFEWIFTN